MRLRIAAMVVAFGAPAVHAETLYVIEQLYVTVNSAPDGSGDRVGQIKSADEVELLERDGEQARVRLASGEEGWVKASYLSADPPLRPQLDARVEEVERLRKEKTQLESELAVARTAATNAAALAKAAAKKEASASRPAPATSAAPVNTAPVSAPPAASNDAPAAATTESGSQSPPPLFQDEPMMPSRPSWVVASLTAILALAIGFALGWRMLDRRIRAKYGGLRIY